MNHDERQLWKDATGAPPPGARSRVWSRVPQSNPGRHPRRWRWVSLSVGLAAAAALLLFLARPSSSTGQQTWPGTGLAWEAAMLEAPGADGVTLLSGRLAVSSWGHPFVVRGAGHELRVEAGVLRVEVAGSELKAELISGAATLDASPLQLRPSAPDTLAERAVSAEPPAAKASHLLADAREEEASGRLDEALATYRQVAASASIEAEIANYRAGELMLRERHDAAAAIALFEEGDRRFAEGPLAQERALSRLEADLKLERWAEVHETASRFLASFPDSERRAEVAEVRARALAALGRWREACAEPEAAPSLREACARQR